MNFPSNKSKVHFDTQTVYLGHHNITYRGVKAIRNPFDYVIYQMIVSELRPDLIIEIGTNIGGGALYLADLLNIVNHGTLHTIDIKKQSDKSLQKHPRIKLFTDGWEGYDINNAKNFNKILVIEDGSHMYEDSLAALKKFSPLVSKDSYYIVEDGIVDELGITDEFHGGPLKAIAEWLPSHDEFVIDRRWCDYFGTNATFNVDGYLRKIK